MVRLLQNKNAEVEPPPRGDDAASAMFLLPAVRAIALYVQGCIERQHKRAEGVPTNLFARGTDSSLGN